MTAASKSGVVHAVLVTFRRPLELARSLDVLRELDGLSGRLVVVDNDPTAGNAALVSSFQHRWSGLTAGYMAMAENTGAAGGLAVGVASILEAAADDDWVLFLDDDNPPEEPHLLTELYRAADRLVSSGVSVGAVGLVGARFDKARGEMVRLSDHELTGLVPVDMIGGGQLPLYSVAALRRSGGPRAELFFGYDDLELGLRLRAIGLGLFAHGELWSAGRERHPRASSPPRRSTFKLSPWRTYYSTRNQVVVARQHGHRPALVRLVLKECLARPLLNLGRAGCMRQTLFTWRGVIDGIRGALGRSVEPDAKKSAG